MAKFTYAQLSALFNYDPKTGVFTWKTRPLSMFASADQHRLWNNRYAGKRAGSLLPVGYVYLSTMGHKWRACRVAWLLTYGHWPNVIDHINADKTDDRIENLRNVDHATNMKNLRRRRDAKSMTGVNWHKRYNKWHVQMGIGGKVKSFGCHVCFGKAAKVRKEAERLHGFHENHGANRKPAPAINLR